MRYVLAPPLAPRNVRRVAFRHRLPSRREDLPDGLVSLTSSAPHGIGRGLAEPSGLLRGRPTTALGIPGARALWSPGNRTRRCTIQLVTSFTIRDLRDPCIPRRVNRKVSSAIQPVINSSLGATPVTRREAYPGGGTAGRPGPQETEKPRSRRAVREVIKPPRYVH